LAGGPGAAENDEDEDDPQHGGDMGRLGRFLEESLEPGETYG